MKKLIILSIVGLGLLSCKKEATTEVAKDEAPKVEAPAVETPEAEVTETETTENAESTEVADGVVKLEISGDDAMKFDKKELKVKAGSKVELTLHHTGKLPKKSMGHNWVLLKPGTDIAEFGKASMSAADTDYIPAGTDAVIVHTDLVGGGESTTITFDAPEAGTYDFICAFPGHYGIMQGKFIVE